MVSQPTLYLLASHHKYEEIVRRLEESETSSLDWTDVYGNNVLHVLCRQQCMSRQAIDAVIAKKPSMAGQPNDASFTPLHLACERRLRLIRHPDTDSIILDLIHACPSAVSKRRESGFARETPLGMACIACADISVLEAMLRVDPSLATPKTYSTPCPLQLLGSCGLKDHVALLLLTAYFGHVVEDRRSFLLHAACFQRIPRDCFNLVLQNNLDQIMEQDHLGNLPLHYALSQQNHTAAAFTEYVVLSLLEHAPEAAEIPNREGRLAVHCALDHQLLTWYKGGLCHVAPRSLLVRDPRTALYPFQMAAIHANQSRLGLSTLYEILRAAPEVLQRKNMCSA